MSDLVLGSRIGRDSTPDSMRCHRGSTGSHTVLSLLSGRGTRRGTTNRSTSQRTSWWNECSDTGGQTTARSSQVASYTVSVSSSSYLESIDASVISTTMIYDLPEEHVSNTVYVVFFSEITIGKIFVFKNNLYFFNLYLFLVK